MGEIQPEVGEQIAVVRHEPRSNMTFHENPDAMLEGAARVATALADVIEKKSLYKIIGQKKHVLVEGWTTLLALQGCLPREESVEQREDGSYLAVVAYVQMATGQVVTRASAECGGPHEMLWQDRHPNARRSMAITRAAGKAARLAYSWIMTLAGYEPTPAEEMDGIHPSAEPEIPSTVRPTSAPAAATRPVPAANYADPDAPEDYVFAFGKNKGKRIEQVDMSYLEWLVKTKAGEMDDQTLDDKKRGYAARDHSRFIKEIARRERVGEPAEAAQEESPF